MITKKNFTFTIILLLVSIMVSTIPVKADDNAFFANNLAPLSDSLDDVVINTMYANGIIGGFPSSGFKGNEPLTRSQLATLLAKAFPLKSFGRSFSDVPETNWAYDYVCAAGQYIVPGDSEKFEPDRQVMRHELAASLAKITNGEIDELVSDNSFPLKRIDGLNMLYQALATVKNTPTRFRILADEKLPVDASIKYSNYFVSYQPLYFKSPIEGNGYDFQNIMTGYVYASWDVTEQKAVFYAKIYVEDNCYEFILKKLASCGDDNGIDFIKGTYDIIKNGKIIMNDIIGSSYGFTLDYFKFYSEAEQWHMSAYKTKCVTETIGEDLQNKDVPINSVNEISPEYIVDITNDKDISEFIALCKKLGVLNAAMEDYSFTAKTSVIFDNSKTAVVMASIKDDTINNKVGFLFLEINNGKWSANGFLWYHGRDDIKYQFVDQKFSNYDKTWLVIRKETGHGTGEQTFSHIWYNMNGKEELQYQSSHYISPPIEYLEYPVAVEATCNTYFLKTVLCESSFEINIDYIINAYDPKTHGHNSEGLLFSANEKLSFKWDEKNKKFIYNADKSTIGMEDCISTFYGKAEMLKNYENEIVKLKDSSEQYKVDWYNWFIGN